VQCAKNITEFDPTLDSGERRYIPPACSMVEVPGSAVACAINFRDLGLASLQGGSINSVLAELMPAMEVALASAPELTEEEMALTSELSKRLSALDKTVEERKAAHLIAARAHLKAVLALAVVAEVRLLPIHRALTCC
jgi:hypothetical protein